MKLSKREAFDIYVAMHGLVSDDDNLFDVLERMKDYVVDDQPEPSDEDEDEDEDWEEEEVEELDDEEEDDVDYDEVIDAADLVELPSQSVVVDAKTQRAKFVATDSGVELVVSKKEKIDNVKCVSITTNVLSVQSGDEWYDFDVKKFGNEWSTLFELDKIYLVN